MTLSLYKFVILGLSSAVGLTLFLFNLTWGEIVATGDNVEMVQSDVAYIKGRLDAYWAENPNSILP